MYDFKEVYTKKCNSCGKNKPLTEFYANKKSRDGRQSKCKPCDKLYHNEWAKCNKEKMRGYRDDWISKNICKNRKAKSEYKKRNRSKVLESKSEYAKANREKYNEWTNRYRAAKLNATIPLSELDEFVVSEIYDKCKMMTELTNVTHDVDHIVPLVSDSVCGLHAPQNLRVIPKHENQSKGNRYWPDMWHNECQP